MVYSSYRLIELINKLNKGINMTGSNSDSLQKANRNLVLSLMRKYIITTRADIAEQTGLKGATITNIISDFIDAGIIIETGFVEGKKGRRSIGISLNDKDFQVIAIRLSRLDFKIGIYDLHGQLEIVEAVPVNVESGVPSIIKRMKESIVRFKSRNNKQTLAIGIALPGPYMKTDNTILQISGFPGWEGINLEDDIESEFGIPTCVEHDGKASALAEWWYGSYSGFNSNLLNVIAGQGNGIGIISQGKIFSGAHGTAGEFGHSTIFFDGPKCACGNKGCLDMYCSTLVLRNNIQSRVADHPESILYGSKYITNDKIAEAVNKEDPFVLEEVRKVARYLGYGLVNAINIIDPDLVVIGDELSFIGKDVFLDEIKRTIWERTLPVYRKKIRIVLSSLSESILLGAMSVGIEKAFHEMKFMEQ